MRTPLETRMRMTASQPVCRVRLRLISATCSTPCFVSSLADLAVKRCLQPVLRAYQMAGMLLWCLHDHTSPAARCNGRRPRQLQIGQTRCLMASALMQGTDSTPPMSTQQHP